MSAFTRGRSSRARRSHRRAQVRLLISAAFESTHERRTFELAVVDDPHPPNLHRLVDRDGRLVSVMHSPAWPTGMAEAMAVQALARHEPRDVVVLHHEDPPKETKR